MWDIINVSDLHIRFQNEDPNKWDDQTLTEILRELSYEHIENDMVRHRAIVQALTILSIQSQRHIDRIEKRNLLLTKLIIFLTITSIIISIIQLCHH